jgi:hypothetical protein
MTPERNVEPILRRWLVDGVDEMPERVYLSIIDRVVREPQRRTWRVLWKDSHVSTYFKPLLAVTAIVAVAVAGFAFLRPSSPAVGPSSPFETPSLSPSFTSSPRPAPSSVGVVGACDLMTAEEAANALGISSLVTTVPLLHPDEQAVAPPVATPFCHYRSPARSLFVLRIEPGTGADAFAVWEKEPGVEAVSGLGDDAAWAPAKTTLYILKGDRLVTIRPMDVPDPTLTLEAAQAIGRIVVTRM